MKIAQATLAFTLLAATAIADVSATKSSGIRGRQLRALQDESFSLPTEAAEPADEPTWECNQAEAWHRDTSMGWADGVCVLNVDCEETSYATEGECCDGAYANQWSKACLKKMPDYDEATDVAEPDMAVCDQAAAWHRNTSTEWEDGVCVLNVDCEETSYATQGECCEGAYANQFSGACVEDMPEADRPTPPPAPVDGEELDMWWPDFSTAPELGLCTNVAPMPSYYVTTYHTMITCCKIHFADQESKKCALVAHANALKDAIGLSDTVESNP